MRTKFIPLIIMLVAGLAACIVTYYNNYGVSDSLAIILAALIIFYIIGHVIKKIADKFLVLEMETDYEDANGDYNHNELDENSALGTNEK